MLWRELLAKHRYAGRIEIIVDVEKRRTEPFYSNRSEITFTPSLGHTQYRERFQDK